MSAPWNSTGLLGRDPHVPPPYEHVDVLIVMPFRTPVMMLASGVRQTILIIPPRWSLLWAVYPPIIAPRLPSPFYLLF